MARLSVVMPVKNALPYLDAAIESILGQSFPDFEFVICDDGSRDGSAERCRIWAARDNRIQLFERLSSLGPSGSSNWAVTAARGSVIARMDADDVARSDRLARQLAVLDSCPDTVLVGSVWEGIDGQGNVVREPDRSTLGQASFAAPFAHGSIMFRRTAFEQAGGYRAECAFWEDLDLYLRIAQVGRVLVIGEPLYRHRYSETSTRLTSHQDRVEAAVDLMFRCRAAHERGEDYVPLLRPGAAAPRRLHPYTFLSLSFSTLWSGGRTHAGKRLMKRGRLRADAVTAKALVWALWSATSPRTLRFVMRALLQRRNRLADARLKGRTVTEWHPTHIAPFQGRQVSRRLAASFAEAAGSFTAAPDAILPAAPRPRFESAN
jgi:glycosyltransferase involved in cell wall biosynthesis